MKFLRDLDVLVLGLGDSGLAMARWCVRHGARVSVWDSRELPPNAEVLARELPQVERVFSLPLPLAGEGGGEGGDAPPPLTPTLSPQAGRGLG
jgi:hypothetical protein